MYISKIDISVIAVYMVVVLGLGVYQALKIKSSGDYYAGGRKFNKFYLIMHALGSATHADEPVSVIGGAYQKGLSGIWYTYLYLPLTPIFWLLAPFIRRTRFVTMADFFRARYDQSMAILYSVIGVLKMSVAIGVVLKGTAKLFDAVSGAQPGSREELMAMLAMTAVFVIYGFAGGLRATVVTEAIQGPLIVIMSILLLPFGLYAAGGFHGLHAALRSKLFDLTASRQEFAPLWILAMALTALIGWVAQPGLVADIGSGKSELEGRIGYTYGTMIKRFCAIGWVFTGVVLAALVAQNTIAGHEVSRLADDRELAFGAAIRALLPSGMIGLMLASIFASQMATLSFQMINSSALASRNLYHGVFRPQATDREVLIFGRVCGLFLVGIGVFLAYALKDVANAITMLLQFTSIMGVVVWGGVLWRRGNVKGAWAAVIVLFVVWAIYGPIGMLARGGLTDTSLAPYLPGVLGIYGRPQFVWPLMIRYLPAGMLTFVIVSLLTKSQPKKQLDNFFMLLKTPVGQEQKLIDAGVPIVYVGDNKPNLLELHHGKLVHWGGFVLAAAMCTFILGLLKCLAWIGSDTPASEEIGTWLLLFDSILVMGIIGGLAWRAYRREKAGTGRISAALAAQAIPQK